MSLYGSKITGVILAGGKNTRFPYLKGFVRFKGIPIIERNLYLMQRFFDPVLISANDPNPYVHLGVSIVSDVIPSRGPLTGIYSCLYYSSSCSVFVAACDMPFISELLVQAICDFYLSQSNYSDINAVVPVYRDTIQPLFGIYSRNVMEDIKKAVLSDKVRMIRFLQEINTHYLEVEGIIGSNEISMKSFININTPNDFETLRLEGYDVDIDDRFKR